jgi:hypothetical protein
MRAIGTTDRGMDLAMSPALKIIASILGQTAGSVALVWIALLIARGAIVKAIDQLAAREIEKYRSELARELERERQAFMVDLERQRSAASVELERFKTELTSGAELRRLVAARRMEVLLAVWNSFEPLMRTALNTNPIDANARAEFGKQLMDYIEVVRDGAVFFAPTLQDALHAYGGTVMNAQRKWAANDPGAFEEARTARDALVGLLRSEFGIA